MVESDELLQAYLRMLQQICGAAAVSLCVPAEKSDSRPLLLHEGGRPAAPELRDRESAGRLIDRVGPPGDVKSAVGIPWQFLSEDEDCRLVRIPLDADLRPSAASPALLRRHADRDREQPAACWIGLRFDGEGFPRESGPISHPVAALQHVLAFGGGLARQLQRIATIVDDPVTGLPGRAEFQKGLDKALSAAQQSHEALTVLLINPDDFAGINERFGSEAGDEMIREVAHRVRSAQRSSDPLARYGGAIFGSLLIDTPLDAGSEVAEKIQRTLAEGTFIEGAIRLGFSVGVAGYDPKSDTPRSPLELVHRAGQALNAAKRTGGNVVRVWEHGFETEEEGNLDRVGGLFTGNMSRDYRNMVLLWESMRVMAAQTNFDELASRAAEQLGAAWKPERIGIFCCEGDTIRLVASRTRNPASKELEPCELQLGPEQIELTKKARQDRETLETVVDGCNCYAVPLVAGREELGCLYLDGSALDLDSYDLGFLGALAIQLAIALDRARLSERERERQEQERRKLRAELDDLRHAIQKSKMVYRSEEMELLLATARRVAPTDATVLITGESGTGKEMMARTLHELSSRRNKPLVVLDCSAIASSLIDSELFGHEKGAYTGADGRKLGRLAEADGATILLDEIGELPLDVQGKLLRFVQERQLTPVGSTRPKIVDVRIIAATNRDLAAQVAEGSFREDLYYRLNVVRLAVPPLRERPDDILHLCNHYLRAYAPLYQKPVRRLTGDAERALTRYSWPGNIRELQNRMMQAVILCEQTELGAEELGLDQEAPVGPAIEKTLPEIPTPPPTPLRRVESPAGLDAASVHDVGQPPTLEDSCPVESVSASLRCAIARQIGAALEGEILRALPLGKWLGEDLLLAADRETGGVARRGAAVIGIPETTFRRRVRTAANRAQAGLATRPDEWDEVLDALERLVRLADGGEDLLESTQQTLFEAVVEQAPGDVKTGSTLMGVSEPTFVKRLGSRKNGASTESSADGSEKVV